MGMQQMLLGGRGAPVVMVHHTGEGGSEGAYSTDGGEDRTLGWVNDGTFNANSGPGTTPYTWLIAGAPADVEIYVHQVSGTAVAGTLDTWLSLSSTRNYLLAWPGGGGSSAASLEVSMRDALTGVVLVNAVVIAMNTHP
jgi:hypothetical protein